MRLLPAQDAGHADVWVAAGTAFLDVLVWRTQLAFTEAGQPACQPVPTSHAPLFRLKGHEGSIHRRAAPSRQVSAHAVCVSS